ncbi:MAG: YHS domain-containing (seleno)protein [Bacteroidia bacterium]|nr:YHS domain-containing (seleno)protein [Bacteroidia bacterium]
MKNILKISFLSAVFILTVMSQGCSQNTSSEIYSTKTGAIKGYDPVAYFTEGRPVKGSDTFTFEWKGATWRFSSGENLAAFKADPAKYAPQYGGYCAYGVADGHKASITPEAFTILNGKLYLNYNKDIQDIWNKDQQGYIQTANKKWETVKKE